MPGITRKMLTIGVLVFALISMGWGHAIAAIAWTPSFSSSTHTVSTSSTNTSVTVSWSAMTPDNGASADSYTYVWDNTSNTSISATKTPTETISGNLSGLTVTRTLTNGTWYFHARAVDSAPNWTPTNHFGPIIIDSSPSPTVTKIEPATWVNNLTSIDVTLTGTNFKKTDGSSFTSVSATIGETSLSNVTVVSATSITATYAIKDKTAGAYSIKVTTDNGASEPLAESFTVTNPAPTITAISPTTAGNSAEKPVTITGTGFLSTATTPAGTANPTVQMRDPDNTSRNFSLTSVSVVSTTSVTATVPEGKTVGEYDVVVTNSDGQSATSANAFQVTAATPTITSVSPDNGTNKKATTITITGTNFQTTGTTLVTLEATGKDSISGTSVNVASTTSITAVIAADQVIATYDVKVTNPDALTATKAAAFTVKNPAATVTSITPDSMTNDSSQAVTVAGTNFRTGATVKIGTTGATGVTLDSTTPSTKLTCTVPANIDAGTYDVSVTNVGAEVGTLSDGFTVNTATTTVALTYSASDTAHVPAGSVTITATFNTSQSAAPTISIAQQGSTDISDATMTATTDDKVWTYAYTVVAATGDTYIDGVATVTIKSSAETTINITTGSTFTIDTISLSASITYSQGTNTDGPFKAGTVTIRVTVTASQTNAPKISIDQQGTTDFTDQNMTATGNNKIWTYDYTVNTKDGTTYKDGTATVSLKTSADADIPIGSGTSFSIDTTAPTVALTYAQGSNTTGPFNAGAMTITATFSETPAATPQIAIDQPGTTDIAATNMTGSARVWTHAYTVVAADGDTYVDGSATVTITNGGDTASNTNATATNNTFTADTTTTVAINTVTTPTGTNSQGITGTMESGAVIVITVTSPVTASTVTYPISTTWASSISSLQEGANTIDVTATDTAGNTGDASTSITYSAPPQVTSATYIDTTHVDVVFNEAVTGGTTKTYYTISGLTVQSVALKEGNTYTLSTSAMTAGETYTVVVSSLVVDASGVGMDSNNNSALYQTGIKGDVNADSEVDSGDAILVLRYSVGLITLTDIEKWAGNVTSKTSNDAIDSGDAIKILRYSVGLITSFD